MYRAAVKISVKRYIPRAEKQKVHQRERYAFGFLADCNICKFPIIMPLQKYHLSHIISVANGGSNKADNLGLAHASCNLKQGKRNIIHVDK